MACQLRAVCGKSTELGHSGPWLLLAYPAPPRGGPIIPKYLHREGCELHRLGVGEAL